jgi:HAD superfamily hydrolase (TIGR01662 family)
MIAAVLIDFGETLVERVVDDVVPLSELVVVAFPEVAETLDRLVADGYRLAVVSNTTQSTERDLRAALRSIQLERCFDVVATSFDVGHAKPAPQLFRHALNALGCRATDAVMVGNDLKSDIGGADALGMTTVLVARGRVPVPDTDIRPTFIVHSLAEVPALLALGRA